MTVAMAVTDINMSIESGDSAATLLALQSPAANIRSVTEECANEYTLSLSDAKAKKGEEECEGWIEHRTREGHAFYYNWKTKEHQWEKPEGLPENPPHLRREEIQV